MVMVCGSFFVASLAQCIAVGASCLLWRCAYPIPFHLFEKASPTDPKILSFGYDEWNFVILVMQVIGEEKYEWIMFKDVVI